MGTCFSSESIQPSPPTAQVVSLNGDLHKFNLPISVSLVLGVEAAAASSSSSLSSSSIFLCNSDSLYYDEYIPGLDLDNQLQANQIYFVLTISKLQQRLSSKDMATLAVQASVAIENAAKNDSYRRKKGRISPVLLVGHECKLPDKIDGKPSENGKSLAKARPERGRRSKPGFSRSGSIRKMQKYTSRGAKLAAVRSFRVRLSTIYEGTVVQ